MRKLTSPRRPLNYHCSAPCPTLEISPTPEIPYSCPILEAGLASVGARKCDAGIFIGRAGKRKRCTDCWDSSQEMQREVLPRDCESAGLLCDPPVNRTPGNSCHAYCGSAHLGLCRLAPMDEEISPMPENQNNSVDTELATENTQADVETSETAAPAAGSPRNSPRLLRTL